MDIMPLRLLAPLVSHHHHHPLWTFSALKQRKRLVFYLKIKLVRTSSGLQGNVEPILNDQEMSFLHQASLQQMAEVLEDDYQKTPFSFKSKEITTLNNFNSSVLYDKPNLGTSRLATNFLKVENEDTYTTKQVSVIAQCAANSPKYLSFGNPDSLSDLQQLYINGIGEEKDEMNFLISKKPKLMNHDISSFQASGRASMGNNPHSSSHDHMIAERKRREKLNEQFLSLSAIIPGLAKVPLFVLFLYFMELPY